MAEAWISAPQPMDVASLLAGSHSHRHYEPSSMSLYNFNELRRKYRNFGCFKSNRPNHSCIQSSFYSAIFIDRYPIRWSNSLLLPWRKTPRLLLDILGERQNVIHPMPVNFRMKPLIEMLSSNILLYESFRVKYSFSCWLKNNKHSSFFSRICWCGDQEGSEAKVLCNGQDIKRKGRM